MSGKSKSKDKAVSNKSDEIEEEDVKKTKKSKDDQIKDLNDKITKYKKQLEILEARKVILMNK